MISEKDYFKLIKQIPYQQCPDELSSQVMQKCNRRSKGNSKVVSKWTQEIFYGAACFLIVMIIVGSGVLNANKDPEYNIRIASNTQVLVGQLIQGAYVVFTGHNKKGSD